MMDPSGSWLEWISVEESAQSAHEMQDLLLANEVVLAQGEGVRLVNLNMPGTLLATNYRIIFVSEGQRKIVPLGTMPVATIEKFSKLSQLVRASTVPWEHDKTTPLRLLQIFGKDMRIIVFNFQPQTKQRRLVWNSLLRMTKPARLWDLYAFSNGPTVSKNTHSSRERLFAEYRRLLRLPSSSIITDETGLTDATQRWRICKVNSTFTFSPTYPPLLIVPSSMSDEELSQAALFRARGRLPVLTWRHPENGAVLARSSQPMVGIMLNNRSNADERLVEALCSQSKSFEERRNLYIADARPRKNALANGAMGGGSESSSNYSQCKVVFLGIENIHAMRDSLFRLRDYLDIHGAVPSDGSSSLLKSGGLTWGGGNLTNMSAAVAALGDSGWLVHVHNVLGAAAWVTARIALEGASVLVHCSDGWDRTAQIVSLAEIMLDPYYRTFQGFQALIEKDWLAFGHPFADRLGIVSYSSNNNFLPMDSMRQGTGQNIFPPPRAPQHTNVNQNEKTAFNNFSPIFLQWIDCVAQLLRLYPCAFEFSSAFLVEVMDCVLSCQFGNFLCNSEKEREHAGISESCKCMWLYLEEQRLGKGEEHEHFNSIYKRGHYGLLLTSAAALAPMLWPNFFLRWASPPDSIRKGNLSSSWVQVGELENQCQSLARSNLGLKKAMRISETRVQGLNSKQKRIGDERDALKRANAALSSSTARLQKENVAMKRALQAMGCKVRFSHSTTMLGASSSEDEDSTSKPEEISSKLNAYLRSASLEDFAVSVSVAPDTDTSADDLRRACGETTVCGDACDYESEEGCKWPANWCTRMGSSFLGLKVNFGALERLSIDDSYFKVKDDTMCFMRSPPEIT